jgi:hypothetical protein
MFESDLLIVNEFIERETQRGNIADNVSRTLLKGDENTWLTVVARAMDQKRYRKKRLSAAR